MVGDNDFMLELTEWPELIFGLVGPIGVNMNIVERKLKEALISVGYNPQAIRLTKLMPKIAVDGAAIDEGVDPVSHYKSRIAYANEVRRKCENDAALAALAVDEIRNIREAHWNALKQPSNAQNRPVQRNAYILRQLKRKEEIAFLRKIYGRKFIQISVHLSERERAKNLERDIAINNANMTPEECIESAKTLVTTDKNERSDDHGQRIEEAFHLGDAFISGRNEESISRTIDRFIFAFFGKNSISPTRDEYGAYIAASASLRSIDLARQVGAAIFSPKGEVIALGCNEVPKYGGGTYWTDDIEPHRDFDDGTDTNRTEKNRIIFDFIRTLEESKLLKSSVKASLVYADPKVRKEIKKAAVSDITEFGRMTHAEMTALSDAARLGRPTAGATMFVTTFPCHNCAKHLIASGLKRVVFVEPYPKSKALALHADSVTLDEKHESRLVFEHFVGISPRRYRDIFEKSSRRGNDGNIAEWYEDKPKPRLEDKGPAYIWNEQSGVFSALQKVAAELGIVVAAANPMSQATEKAGPKKTARRRAPNRY